MVKKNTLFYHSIILFLGCFSCGLLALWLGQDANWDLKNYHYYIPYAFLNHRFDLDFLPSGLQTFLNPFLDILNYYLLKNLKPTFAEFILGALQGINCYLMFLLTKQLLGKIITSYQYIFLPLIAGVSLYSANFISQIGTTFNDLIINVFILTTLIGFFNLFAEDNAFGSTKRLIFFAFFLGAGIGFKMAFAPYAIGFLIALFFLNKNFKFNFYLALCAGAGIFIGFLLTNGYWMFFLWEHTKSPFFPYFNKLFHSPYAIPYDVIESHRPKTTWQALTFPYFNSTNLYRLVAQVPYKDYRYIATYILLIFLLAKLIYMKVKNFFVGTHLTLKISTYPRYRFLFVFSVVSYLIWEYFFSIERYLITLSLLCPIIIIISLYELISNKKIFSVACFSVLSLLVVTMTPMNWSRTPIYSENFFNVSIPKFVDTTYPGGVILQDRPTGFLVPFFPSSWTFVLITDRQYFSNKMEAKLELALNSLINNYKNLYLIILDKNMQPSMAILNRYHLKIEQCAPISSSIQNKMMICKMKKT